MKVLKSGIEMTPDELNELKGGFFCTCGCGIGYNGEQLNASSSDGGGKSCVCGCIPGTFEVFGDMNGAAHVNKEPEV